MELVGESWVGRVVVVSLRILVNVLFSFFFVGTDLILLGRESVSESWISKVVVVSLKTFVNVLFCRNGSIGLEDFWILLEMKSIGEFFWVWDGWVYLRTFITVLSLSFLQERLLFLEIEPVGESWVSGVVVISLRMFINVFFFFSFL